MTTVGGIQSVNELNPLHPLRVVDDVVVRKLNEGAAIIEDHERFYINIVHFNEYLQIKPLSNHRVVINGREYHVKIDWIKLSPQDIECLCLYQKVLDVRTPGLWMFVLRPIPKMFRRQISFARAWSVPIPDDLRRVVFEFMS